jgi:hypothetical protein
MSLVTFIGPRPNLLGIDETDPPMRLEAEKPILTAEEMEKIRHIALFTGGTFRSLELDICYPATWGAAGMEAALASLCAHAEDATRLGYNILIVSDRKVSATLMPIPALLATAAVHQHLVRKGLRTSTGLVVETGSAREVHHFALLAGYGAEAIHPYLALESLAQLHAYLPDISPEESAKRFIKAICKGLYKVIPRWASRPTTLLCGSVAGQSAQLGVYRQVFHRHGQQIEGIGCSRSPRRHRNPDSHSAPIRCCATRSTRAGTPLPRRGSTCGRRTRSPNAARPGRTATRPCRDYARLVNEQGKRLMTLRGCSSSVRRARAPGRSSRRRGS